MASAAMRRAYVLVALLPAAVDLPALLTVTIVSVLLAAVLAYETWRFADLRDRLRHPVEH
jgi:hypothetical protein